MVRIQAFAAVVVMFFSMQAIALAPDSHVGDFRLFDHTGGSHHLHYFSDKKAVVLLVQDLSCAASQETLTQTSNMIAAHGDDVEFFVINSTSAREDVSLAMQTQQGNQDMRVLIDDAQLVGRTYGLTNASPALVSP